MEMNKERYWPYDLDTISKMYDMRFAGMPLSFLLLDERKTDTNCHFCASFMSLLFPDAKRIEGRMECLDGDYHSWVEKGEYVYDTSKLSIWSKDAYYEHCGVLSTEMINQDQIDSETKKFLNDYGCNEQFVAWIMDLEENIDKLIYKVYIKKHIERFKKEINYDSLKLDYEKVEDIRNGIRELYKEIEQFKISHPVLVKKNK